METGWLALVSAVLAGGLFNQLFNAFWGDRITHRREIRKWKRTEKYKVFSELIDLVSSSNPECGYEKWPGKIRSLSQQVYLLHNCGKPPQKLCDHLEEVFQVATDFKSGEGDKEELRSRLRITSSLLRRELASSLENDE